MYKLDQVEEFVLKVSRICGMLIMAMIVLSLTFIMAWFVISKISPIFKQKYPKITFEITDFKAPVSTSSSNNVESVAVVDDSFSGKLADEILKDIKKDFEATLERVVKAKGYGLVRGQLSDELKALSAVELEEQLDAVIKDTTPKYWKIFSEKSRSGLKNDIDYISGEEAFQEDFADKLVDYLKESSKQSYSPYGVFNYQGEETDFITDIRLSKVYKKFKESYAFEKSNLESKNISEDFFTTPLMISMAFSILLLLFTGVLFSIIRIEKHMSQRKS